MKQLFPALLIFVFYSSIARSEEFSPAELKLAQEAPGKLLTVKEFSIGGTCESGARSPAEISLRALLKSPNALAECKKLVTDASPAGQLYGLLGLKILDAKAFQAALPRFIHSKVSLMEMSGCVTYGTTVDEITADIEQGKIK